MSNVNSRSNLLNWLTPGNYEKWKRGSAQVGAPNTRLASEINLAIQENGINHDITVAMSWTRLFTLRASF